MLDTLKLINLGLAFLLELAMLAGFAYWGVRSGQTTLMKVLLGVGIPLLVAIIWGIFMAPNSTTRLRGAVFLGVKILLFLLASVALYMAGSRVPGILLAVIFALNEILQYIWHQ